MTESSTGRHDPENVPPMEERDAQPVPEDELGDEDEDPPEPVEPPED
jgi:hypothetical protein